MPDVKNGKTQSRDSRFEWLRILAMLLIVSCHLTAYNGWGLEQHADWIGTLALAYDQYAGQFGVSLFFLLSGYFLVDKPFSAWRIGKTIVQTFCYSFVCLIVGLLLGVDVSVKDIYRSLLPVINNMYWFITAYVLMLMVSPVLNMLIDRYDRRTVRRAIIGLISLGVLPYVTFMGFAYNGLQWTTAVYAITGYLIGGYIRRYRSDCLRWSGVGWLIVSIMAGFALLTAFLWSAQHQIAPARFFAWQPRSIYGSLPVFALGAASLAFTLLARNSLLFGPVHASSAHSRFVALKPVVVNAVASTTFGIYLIHQQPIAAGLIWSMVSRAVPKPGGMLQAAAYMLLETLVLFIVLGVISFIMDALVVRPIWRCCRTAVAAAGRTIRR